MNKQKKEDKIITEKSQQKVLKENQRLSLQAKQDEELENWKENKRINSEYSTLE